MSFPLSVMDLSRITGVSRMTIMREIERGRLTARRRANGTTGDREVYEIDLAEGARWRAAYLRYARGPVESEMREADMPPKADPYDTSTPDDSNTVVKDIPPEGPVHGFQVTHYQRPTENRAGWSQHTSAEGTPDEAISFIRQRLLES